MRELSARNSGRKFMRSGKQQELSNRQRLAKIGHIF